MSNIYHKHHIIPKHMGGSDDPSNIIELTIEEHAEAHRKLFEQYGRWQDKLAWKALSGAIDKNKISSVIQKNRVIEGTHHFLGGAIQRKIVADGRHNFLGGKIQTESNKKRIDRGDHNLLGPSMNAKLLAQGIHPSQKKVKCEHCGKVASSGMYRRWHGENCKFRQ